MSNQMHATDDALELYSLGRLNEPEASEVEEHLLICEQCQERLQREDCCVHALRSALDDDASRGAEPRRVLPFVNWRWPSVAILSTAAIAAMVLITFTVTTPPPAQELTLLAQRGAEVANTRAAAGRPITLRIDTTELGAAATYRVEVVNGAGVGVWTRVVQAAALSIRVEVGDGLNPGRYWVRVYNAAGTGDALREFGITVE
jgi:anti-sigma factor RsiW